MSIAELPPLNPPSPATTSSIWPATKPSCNWCGTTPKAWHWASPTDFSSTARAASPRASPCWGNFNGCPSITNFSTAACQAGGLFEALAEYPKSVHVLEDMERVVKDKDARASSGRLAGHSGATMASRSERSLGQRHGASKASYSAVASSCSPTERWMISRNCGRFVPGFRTCTWKLRIRNRCPDATAGQGWLQARRPGNDAG